MRNFVKSATALAAVFSNFGLAQAQVPNPPPAEEVDEIVMDEIIITAQKREQRLSEVPLAVTAYSGTFLDKIGVTKFDELALFTPGLRVQEQSANNPGFVVRGITTDSGSAFDEPRVAIFQDGVSTSRNRGAYVELFDLERVEVAKGPQATLFGRAAMIGGINVIQNKADIDSFGGDFEVGAGEDGYFRAVGVLNASIIDGMLGLRIGATNRQRDGWVTNLEGGEALQGVDATAYRGVLSFEASPNLRFDLIYNHHEDDNSGTAFKSGTFIPAGSSISAFTPARLNVSASGFEGGQPMGLTREVDTLTLLGDWSLNDAWTLTSISGWRDFNSLELNDPDGSSMPFIQGAEDAEGEQWSQELRLSFEGDGPLSGFFGVSMQHEEGSQRAAAQYDERFATALLSGGLVTTPTRSTPSLAEAQAISTGFLRLAGLSAPVASGLVAGLKPAHYEQSTNFGETDSLDIYGDLTWQATERLELTAGLRWTEDEKTSQTSADLLNGPSRMGVLIAALNSPAPTQQALITALLTPGAPLPAIGAFTQPTSVLTRSDTFDDFTWRAVARYEFSDTVSAWSSISRGRRPEVISLTPGNLPGTAPLSTILPAETVDSLESGVAVSMNDGNLRLNASAYYYDYKNFQTQQFQAGRLVTITAGNATAPGAELQLTWRPVEDLDLFATYAYSHARFDGGAFDGNQFRLAPDHALSAGGSWSKSIAGVGTLSLTPTYTWQSKVYFSDNNDRRDLQLPLLATAPGLRDRAVDEVQDGYGSLNLRLRLATDDARWGLEVFGTNLLDTEYLLDAGNTGDSFTFPTFIPGAPRLLGVRLISKF